MISPFGVDHGEEFGKRKPDPERGGKVYGSGLATGAVVGGTAAAVMGRKNASKLGGNLASRASRRAVWSNQRADLMPDGKLKTARKGYARKLHGAAAGPMRNPDVNEWAGRAAFGGLTGGTAGGVVYGRKKLTPKEGKK